MEIELFLVKPDGVEYELVGDCLVRLKGRGLKMIGAKLIRFTREQAEVHYAEHKGKDFFENLVTTVTSGPMLAIVFKGHDAVKVVRSELGPSQYPPKGTIRGDLSKDVSRNVAHASDSPEAAKREIALLFGEDELIDW